MSGHQSDIDTGLVLVIVLFLGLSIAIPCLIAFFYNYKKSAAIEKTAKQKGWSFEKKVSALPFATDFPLFRVYGKNWNRSYRNVLQIKRENLEAVIFEFNVLYGGDGGHFTYIVAHFQSPKFNFPTASEHLPEDSYVAMRGNEFLCYRKGRQNAASVSLFMDEAFETLNRFRVSV